MRKISSTYYEGTFSEFLNKVSIRQKMLPKLKEIVRKEQKFEEEYVQYAYRGKDADLILDCMEFFYENLWSMCFRDFVWTNPKDDWENYHIILEYNGKYSEVEIVYGHLPNQKGAQKEEKNFEIGQDDHFEEHGSLV